MNLLNLPDMNTPEGQGLLAAAFNLMQAQKMPGKRGLGGALGGAGQAYIAGAQQARERDMIAKLRQAQISQIDAQAADRKAEAEEKERVRRERERKQGVVSGMLTPNVSEPQFSVPEVGGIPMFGQPVTVNKPATLTPGRVDPLRLLREGFTPAEVESYAKAAEVGMPEVARTIEGTDAKGNKVTYQYDKRGNLVGSPVMGYVAPVQVDTGADIQFVRPEAGSQFTKSMSPAERDAAARGWASNRIAQQRLALDQGVAVADMGGPNQIALTRQFGKADKGYRWKPDGTQERIPGGPADEKSGLDAEKRAQRTRLAVDRADFVLGQLDQLGKNAGFFETGLTGAALGVVPGTDAYDVRRLADSIKANIGFGELQAMREASPTGGALGQVAVQELNFLQSALGSLDANQSRAQLNNSIAKVKQHYSNWKNIMQQAQAPNTGGASGGWSAQPASVQSEDGWSAQPRR